MSAKDIETLTCAFCEMGFEVRQPIPFGWTPACDTCILKDPERGRVARRTPAKRFNEEFDSPRSVQELDRDNLRLWWDIREKYEH